MNINISEEDVIVRITGEIERPAGQCEDLADAGMDYMEAKHSEMDIIVIADPQQVQDLLDRLNGAYDGGGIEAFAIIEDEEAAG